MIGDASHATVGRRHDRHRGLGFPQVRPGSAESGGTGCAPTDRSTLWGQTNSTHLTFNTSMYAPPAPPEHVWQRPSCDRRSASAPQQPDEPDATTTISPVESSAEPCWRCFHGLRVVYSTHFMPAAHAVWVYRAPNRSICVACPSPMCRTHKRCLLLPSSFPYPVVRQNHHLAAQNSVYAVLYMVCACRLGRKSRPKGQPRGSRCAGGWRGGPPRSLSGWRSPGASQPGLLGSSWDKKAKREITHVH